MRYRESPFDIICTFLYTTSFVPICFFTYLLFVVCCHQYQFCFLFLLVLLTKSSLVYSLLTLTVDTAIIRFIVHPSVIRGFVYIAILFRFLTLDTIITSFNFVLFFFINIPRSFVWMDVCICSRMDNALMFLLKLAWDSRFKLPLLITIGFMVLDIRMQLEITVESRRVRRTRHPMPATTGGDAAGPSTAAAAGRPDEDNTSTSNDYGWC